MKKYLKSLNNLFFMIKRVFVLDKKSLLIKLPLCFTQIVQIFIPLIFVRQIINGIQEKEPVVYILTVVGSFAVSTFVCDIMKKFLMCMDERQSDSIYRLVRKDIARLVAQMPYYEAEKTETRDFIQLVQESVDISGVYNLIFDFFRQILTLCGLMAIVITLHPILIVLVAGILVLRVIANQQIRNLWEKWRYPINTAYRKVNYMISVMSDVGYGKEIRMNGLQQWFAEKMSGTISEYIDGMKHYNHSLQKRNAFVEGAVVFQECVLYVVLAYKVVFKKMLIGDFSMYLSGIASFSNCLFGLVDIISNLLQEGQFLGQYRELVENDQKLKLTDSKKYSIDKNINHTITFKNVSFHYPNSERLILNNVSFELQTNQSLSIVGLNGAGKTTIVKLVCRFYEPTEGEILLNGVNIQNIDEEEYRNFIGVVFQDFQLFAFSIVDNIALSPNYEEQEVWNVLQKSGLYEKVQSLKEGIHTAMTKEFDEYGVEFSGGESQRVEFARVLYKQAGLVILDEPTASLDPLTEYNMYKTMHEMTRNRCAIFISHRLSSTRFTDKIIVLENGQIIESGSFDELMKTQDGFFRNMFNLQQEQYLV